MQLQVVRLEFGPRTGQTRGSFTPRLRGSQLGNKMVIKRHWEDKFVFEKLVWAHWIWVGCVILTCVSEFPLSSLGDVEFPACILSNHRNVIKSDGFWDKSSNINQVKQKLHWNSCDCLLWLQCRVAPLEGKLFLLPWRCTWSLICLSKASL